MLSDAQSLLTAVADVDKQMWDFSPVEGADGWQHLIGLHDQVEAAATECVNALPSGEWLSLVRSMPARALAASGALESTPLLTRALMTALTAGSTHPPSSSKAVTYGGMRWRQHDDETIERLDAIALAASSMRALQSAAWWVGKGAALRPDRRRTGAWYTVDASSLVKRRVKEFDEGPGHGVLAALGSTAGERPMTIPEATSDPLCVAFVFEQPDFHTKWIVGKREGAEVTTPFSALCSTRFGSLAGYIDQAVGAGSGPAPELGPVAFGCLALLRLLLEIPAREQLGGGTGPAFNMPLHAQERGFHAAPRGWLTQELTWVTGRLQRFLGERGVASPSVPPDALVSMMSDVPRELFPAAAPPLRNLDGGWIAIDFVSATRQLSKHLLLPPTEGSAANLWARPFEDQVQAIIDLTPWAPPKGLRDLRGRDLRLGGETVTDIDAVGCRGTTLLIIDAKARTPRPGLWRGEFAAVRADDDHARKNLSNWTRVVRTLREFPAGDNYDFSGYTYIEGAVCYPYRVFTLAPQAGSSLRNSGIGMLTSPEEMRELMADPHPSG